MLNFIFFYFNLKTILPDEGVKHDVYGDYINLHGSIERLWGSTAAS